MNRIGDFAKKSCDILAKRVGYKCSNPACGQDTVGPNQQSEKATNIGIAAHITAASAGGPRYDATLSSSERKHPNNGIWLCSNCATLIDRDALEYSVELLKSWKERAEQKQSENIKGRTLVKLKHAPFIECDLIWTGGGRSPRGMSLKNPIEMHEGRPVMVPGPEPIQHWEVRWRHNFVITNNSNNAAYNVKIEILGNIGFDKLAKLERVNNLPPYQKFTLVAESFFYMEGRAREVQPIQDSKIPEHLEGLTIKISYQDDERNTQESVMKITDNKIVNFRL